MVAQTKAILQDAGHTMMEAATLNCPMCGAPAASDATQCEHCHARLATVACPSCFGMIFVGSKFCPHCGAAVNRATTDEPEQMPCPRCKTVLGAVMLGGISALECQTCDGLWVKTETFNAICADREKQAAVIGIDSPAQHEIDTPVADAARYLPCVACGEMMNRMNFANRSGIIIDICKPHGAWFDRDELRRIVEFIRNGGLDTARAIEIQKLESEKRIADFSSLLARSGRGSMDASPSSIPSSMAFDVVGDALVFIGRVIFGWLK